MVTARPILTAAETRAAEQALFDDGITVEALMERAGVLAAEAAWRFAGPRSTLVVCGPGNNGGDGYVIARTLKAKGVPVRVAALSEPVTPAARAARASWDGPVEDFAEARPASLLVDALFGTGLTRPLAEHVSARLGELAEAAALVVAIDLPSGIATDDGAILSPVPDCDMTVALGCLKPAHRLRPAVAACGRIVVADIGLPGAEARLVEVARPMLATPGPGDHKYSRGKVAVLGGAMPGAAMLAAEAAQRAGAGYVELLNPRTPAAAPHALVRRGGDPAGALADGRIGALVVGPGLGRDDRAEELLTAALASGRPLVIDADALVLLADGGLDRLRALDGDAVLTPHEGEFVRLFGEIAGSRIDRARIAAARAGCVVLLKGADSVVAHPDGRAGIAPPAPGWLASAGTGDVLAGIIAAMRAGGRDPFAAAQAGLWLHAEAARLAGPALIADDLVRCLPAAVGACL